MPYYTDSSSLYSVQCHLEISEQRRCKFNAHNACIHGFFYASKIAYHICVCSFVIHSIVFIGIETVGRLCEFCIWQKWAQSIEGHGVACYCSVQLKLDLTECWTCGWKGKGCEVQTVLLCLAGSGDTVYLCLQRISEVTIMIKGCVIWLLLCDVFLHVIVVKISWLGRCTLYLHVGHAAGHSAASHWLFVLFVYAFRWYLVLEAWDLASGTINVWFSKACSYCHHRSNRSFLNSRTYFPGVGTSAVPTPETRSRLSA